MKITIFGGTGRTGQHLVEQALEAGHEVTVLARTPGKLALQSEALRVVEGDIRDAGQVAEAVKGAEAVISVLGPTSNTPDYQVSKGTAHILAAMTQHGVRRLVISAGAGVNDPNDAPTLMSKVIGVLLKLLSRHVYEDMVQTVALVRDSAVDWTIVRVPMLTNDPSTGRVRAGYIGKGVGSRIGRADMAAFILEQVDSDTYLHQAPVIST